MTTFLSGTPRSVAAPVESRTTATELTAEIEAILAVGEALTRLQDGDSRRRVLDWAVARFSGTIEPTPVVEHSPAPQDPNLCVDELAEFFDAAGSHIPRGSEGLDDPLDDIFELPMAAQQAAPPADRPEPLLDALVADLVGDFRPVALGF